MPFPCQVSDLRLARPRHGPEAPDFLAGGLIECGDEAAHAFIAARRAGDDEVSDGQRRAGRVVVLAPVGHLGFPQQRAGEAVQRDEVRVVGDHEHAVAGDGDAAVDAAGRVADQALGARTLVVPDLAAAAGIERVALVGAGDIHHAVHDHRRHLQARGVAEAEDPLGHECAHIARRDLRQRAVAAAAGLAVVTGPVGLRGDGAIALAALAEQVDLAGRRRAAAGRARSD